jgi:aspartate ammonia-lyase
VPPITRRRRPVVRREADSLGPVEVPADALYGAHTVRALANFGGSGLTLGQEPELLLAMCEVKAACALANANLGEIDPEIASAIVAAADEVIAGAWRDQFPSAVVQGGGGTSTNMNVNEVLANRAGEILGARRGAYSAVHPNDHVNRSQSTNDTYPTAMSIACIRLGARAVVACRGLAKSFSRKASEYRGRDHLGRTCLQDAVPLPIAATHTAQARVIAGCANDLERAILALRDVPLGGTAVGTGIGAPRGFGRHAIAALNARTRLRLRPAGSVYASMAFLPQYLVVASAASRCAIHMARIAQDLRILSSGPAGGIGEIELPAVQVGSSLMPGKVNPVIPELVIQVSFAIRGAEAVVVMATAAGELELNAMEPVIVKHLLGSLRDLESAAAIFATRCVDGLSWNQGNVEAHLTGSLAGAVEKAVELGYESAARSTKRRRV